jgi:serine/threonine protein kinase
VAFGVLVYQMLLQRSPFQGEDADEIYDAILEGEVPFPSHLPDEAVSMLRKLLVRDPDQRLGGGSTDAQEVMKEPFFQDIIWDDVHQKKLQPPFVPTIQSETDTSNFDPGITSLSPILTPILTPTQPGISRTFLYFLAMKVFLLALELSQAMRDGFTDFDYAVDVGRYGHLYRK